MGSDRSITSRKSNISRKSEIKRDGSSIRRKPKKSEAKKEINDVAKDNTTLMDSLMEMIKDDSHRKDESLLPDNHDGSQSKYNRRKKKNNKNRTYDDLGEYEPSNRNKDKNRESRKPELSKSGYRKGSGINNKSYAKSNKKKQNADRTYDDDRDRTYNDDRDRSYNDRTYDDGDKKYDDKDKKYNDNTYDDRDRTYNDDRDRGYNDDRDRTYDDRTYDDRDRKYDDRDRSYDDRDRTYQEKEKRDSNRGPSPEIQPSIEDNLDNSFDPKYDKYKSRNRNLKQNKRSSKSPYSRSNLEPRTRSKIQSSIRATSRMKGSNKKQLPVWSSKNAMMIPSTSKPKVIGKKEDMANQLLIITMKKLISDLKTQNEELKKDKEELKTENQTKEKKIKDLSKKLEDYELMEKMDEDRPSKKIKVDIEELDSQMKNIDEYLHNISYNPDQNKLVDEIIQKNNNYNILSEENKEVSKQLKSNVNNIRNTLTAINENA
jgi:pre-mRNA-splicing factor 38A